jgi:quercetin dioxygenase-like cupin family protein
MARKLDKSERRREMNRSHLIRVFIAVVGIGMIVWSSAQAGEEHTFLKAADKKWTDGPPSMPPGAQMILIEGDLKKAEPFVFQLKLPAGYEIAPHTHPTAEHVTVLSGTFYMGTGEQLDPNKAVALTPGSFAAFEPGESMFALTKEETVIQVHGIGPWGISYENAEDDPRKK